jgi:hypothetical protein
MGGHLRRSSRKVKGNGPISDGYHNTASALGLANAGFVAVSLALAAFLPILIETASNQKAVRVRSLSASPTGGMKWQFPTMSIFRPSSRG